MSNEMPAEAPAETNEGKVTISPQAALNEYADRCRYFENRNLLLAQQVHDLTLTLELVTKERDSLKASVKAEIAKNTLIKGSK